MWRRIKGFIFILIGAVNVCLFLALMSRWFLSETVDTPPMMRGDYIDLSLSLLSVLLTAITIFLAIAAFFAYYDLRNAAERMAEKTTMSVFQKLSQQGYLDYEGERISLESALSAPRSASPAAPDPHTIGGGNTRQEEEKGDV